MNIKTTIWRLALCLSGLSAIAACSDYLDNSEGFSTSLGHAIEVNAMIGNTADAETRAASSSDVTTATLRKFWMWGYNGETALSGTVPGDGDSKTAVTLSDREFTDTLTKGSFTDGGTYYWPTAQVKFIAVSSTEGADPALDTRDARKVVVASTGVTATDFTVETSGKITEFKNQEDYIVAVNKTAKPSASNKINLTFQHMLSRVSINAYAPNFSTKHPSLACFGFDGVQKTGTFTYTGDLTDKPFDYANGGADGDKCWSVATSGQTGLVGSIYKPDSTAYNTSNDYWFPSGAFQVTATVAPAAAKRLAYSSYTAPWLNVIPGSSVASKLHITLWYEGSAWPFDIDLAGLSLAEYKPGYQYIYNICVYGTSDSEGEKIRPEVEIYSVTVAEWNSTAVSETIDAPDAANGNTLKKQIEAAQEKGDKNLEIQLTTTAVNEVTVREQISVTTNVVIDLNDHDLTPDVPDTNGVAVAAFKVSGGHRLAIKGTGKVNVALFNKLVELAAETGLTNTFAIRGGTWTIDPQMYVPGYTSEQTYTQPAEGASYQITCSGSSWNYTVIRNGQGTDSDPYTYTVSESAKS